MRSRRFALASALLLALSACKRAPAEAEEKTASVEVRCEAARPGPVDESIALRGHIAPPPGGDLPVASQVQGRVVEVAVHEGQRVASGDLVAAVDDSMSRDALRQAEASLVQAHAAEKNAATSLERTRGLVDRKIAARQELEDAVARDDAARAQVSSAEAAVDQARRTLGRVYVRSSFSGVVTRVWRGPGALVDGTAGTPIVQLAADAHVELVADATERELRDIHEGQDAKGTLQGGGAALIGKVRAKSSALEPSGLGTIRISLEGTSESLPIGSFGRVVITTAHRDAALLLPAAALRGAVLDGPEVAICKGGKIELRAIKVGFRDDARVEVLSGLAKDDRVALDHVLGLDDGTPITEAK